MFVLANFIVATAKVLNLFLTLYLWIVVIAAVITWVNPDPYNPIVRFLYRATEPVLRPLRRILPTSRMGVDFSPILAIAMIIFLQTFVVESLFQLAKKMEFSPSKIESPVPPASKQSSEELPL